MKHSIIINIIILLVFFTNIYSKAQKIWSLDECIKYAHQNNIQIKQAELNAILSSNVLLQSKAELLPNLNFSTNHSYSFGNSVDPFTQTFEEINIKSTNLGFSSSLSLFNGFQNYNSIKKNEFDLKASLKDVERIKNDISLNIASAYLQILFNYELVDISANQLETTKKQVERTGKLVDAGSIAKGNLLEIESQLAQEELQLVNAQNQLIISYLILTQFLDFDSVGQFTIERPDIQEVQEEEITADVDEIYLKAKDVLPQIAGGAYRLKSSEKELEIARGYMLPNLNLNASYGTGYSDARMRQIYGDPIETQIGYLNDASITPVYAKYNNLSFEDYAFKDQLIDNKSLSLTFSLSIPIFNKYQIKTAMDNAKINVLQSKNDYQLVKDQLYKDIQQAHANANASLKKHIASKKTVQSTKEAFRYTEQKYEVGNVNSVDYAIAKNNLLRAKSDNLQAKYEYMFSMKILDFYMGKQLNL